MEVCLVLTKVFELLKKADRTVILGRFNTVFQGVKYRQKSDKSGRDLHIIA